MIDPQARPAAYFKLMVLVVVLGVISALITFAFMALVQQGTELIWEQAAQALGVDPRLFTVLVCTMGGVLVGLLVKFFGDHSGIFAEIMHEFGKTGRFDYRNAPGIVITAFVSLISGASLGPEAPLADACGGIGTLLSDRLNSMSRKRARWAIPASAGCSPPSSPRPSAGRCWAWNRRRAEPTGGGVFLGAVSQPAGLGRGHGGLRLVEREFLRDVVSVPRLYAPAGGFAYAAPLGLIGGAVGVLFMFHSDACSDSSSL